jgi:pyruvate kinase
MKKTKIIATISNKMCSVPFLKSLADAGMNVARLNTAHQSIDEALQVIQNVRAVSDRIAIMIDTKGPEIRTTQAAEEIPVKTGDIVCVQGSPGGTCRLGHICVSYEHFVEDLNPGDRILIDDGDIELLVKAKDEECLQCEAQNDGVIKGRKSVNIPSVHIRNLPALSEKDKAFIEFAIDQDIEFIAHSFVRNKNDVLAIQSMLDEKGSAIKIIAKIENQGGVDHIDEILDHAYGAMIARGDLAIEIPAERIPIIQKNLVQKCIERRKPVIIATQMLQSMIYSPRPTRAEVSDVANACLDHTDAIMLSGETAQGKYPLESVKMMAKIADEVERTRGTFTDTRYEAEQNVTGYLAKAAVKASLRLPVKALVADTISGKTILSLVAYRGESPIYAQCYRRRVMRELALSFGVHTDYMPTELTSTEFLTTALNRLIEEKHIDADDLITVLAGHFGSANGASFVEISTARNMLEKK